MSYTSEVLMSEDSLQFKGSNVGSDLTLVFRPEYYNKGFVISTGIDYDDYKDKDNVDFTIISESEITTSNVNCELMVVGNIFSKTIEADHLDINIELNAINADINNCKVDTLVANTLKITKTVCDHLIANFSDLTYANIDDTNINFAKIEKQIVKHANIDILKVSFIDCKNINIDSGFSQIHFISFLDSDTANITTMFAEEAYIDHLETDKLKLELANIKLCTIETGVVQTISIDTANITHANIEILETNFTKSQRIETVDLNCKTSTIDDTLRIGSTTITNENSEFNTEVSFNDKVIFNDQLVANQQTTINSSFYAFGQSFLMSAEFNSVYIGSGDINNTTIRSSILNNPTITNASVDTATISGSLNVTGPTTISNTTITDATVTNCEITNGSLDDLFSNKGNILDLDATTGTFKDVNTVSIDVTNSTIQNIDTTNLIVTGIAKTTINQLATDYTVDQKEYITKEYFDNFNTIDADLRDSVDETVQTFITNNQSTIINNVTNQLLDVSKYVSNVAFIEYTEATDKRLDDLESNVEELQNKTLSLEDVDGAIANVNYVDSQINNLKSEIPNMALTGIGIGEAVKAGNLDIMKIHQIVDLATHTSFPYDAYDAYTVTYDPRYYELNFKNIFHFEVDGSEIKETDTLFIKDLKNIKLRDNVSGDPIIHPEYYNGIYDVIEKRHSSVKLRVNENFRDVNDVSSSFIHIKSKEEGGRGTRNAGMDYFIISPTANDTTYKFGNVEIQFVTIGKQDVINTNEIYANTDIFKLNIYDEEVFTVSADGECQATSFTCPSDVNLKKDIDRIENTSELLNDIHGYTFNWKGKSNAMGKSYGFIAQEVERVMPSMVYTTNQGIKTIDYSKFCAILVESNREKDEKINEMTQDLDSIKKEMQTMKELFNNIALNHNLSCT